MYIDQVWSDVSVWGVLAWIAIWMLAVALIWWSGVFRG